MRLVIYDQDAGLAPLLGAGTRLVVRVRIKRR
jgi:hypothetical protein